MRYEYVSHSDSEAKDATEMQALVSEALMPEVPFLMKTKKRALERTGTISSSVSNLVNTIVGAGLLGKLLFVCFRFSQLLLKEKFLMF